MYSPVGDFLPLNIRKLVGVQEWWPPPPPTPKCLRWSCARLLNVPFIIVSLYLQALSVFIEKVKSLYSGFSFDWFLLCCVRPGAVEVIHNKWVNVIAKGVLDMTGAFINNPVWYIHTIESVGIRCTARGSELWM
jgi:hypothetical protein